MKTPTVISIPENARYMHVPAKWQWHLHTLLRLRNRIQHQSIDHLSAAEQPRSADHDFADRANEESEFENLIAEVRSEEALLSEIDAALERLRDGTYGICTATQSHIPAERLRAVPWSRFSREAADHLEKHGGNRAPAYGQ
jgi:RNA polymerase-binding protein DksA